MATFTKSQLRYMADLARHNRFRGMVEAIDASIEAAQKFSAETRPFEGREAFRAEKFSELLAVLYEIRDAT